MKIDIPLPCPKCAGKMYSVSYDVTLSILKNRSWQICKECNFERNTEEFKKSMEAAAGLENGSSALDGHSSMMSSTASSKRGGSKNQTASPKSSPKSKNKTMNGNSTIKIFGNDDQRGFLYCDDRSPGTCISGHSERCIHG